MAKAVAVSKFKKLISDISAIYERTQKMLVKNYWEIGRRIVEDEQDGEIKARYGDKLIESLSEELLKKYGPGFSKDNLFKIRKFYLTHPKVATSQLLKWSHYVPLLSVADKRKRERLEALARRKKMTSRQIKEKVKKINVKGASQCAAPTVVIKPPTNLCLDTFKKISDQPKDILKGEMIIDCGFYVGVSVPKSIKISLTEKPSYTYRAYVEKVVDGDTILARIDLGFKIQVYERLRLSSIDAPELKTPQGDKAKKYVLGILPKGKKLIIKSYKNDIYGRFIADIFYSEDANADFDAILDKGIYLNQQLLTLGLAKVLEM